MFLQCVSVLDRVSLLFGSASKCCLDRVVYAALAIKKTELARSFFCFGVLRNKDYCSKGYCFKDYCWVLARNIVSGFRC